ncbi:MAG: hypothetical protein ACXW18_12255 [Pyrinomonadaceae bacterium]
MSAKSFLFAAFVLSLLALTAQGQPKVVIERNTGVAATPNFKFKNVPLPSRDDAGAKANVTFVDAEPDGNGGPINALNDGVLPDAEDQPRRNFFLASGSGGGRLRFDLGSGMEITQINSYSWHSDSRGPQLYRIWASDGADPNFNAEPKGNVDPKTCGWRLLAIVDTRTDAEDGGQYGVSITDSRGSLGQFRYLLFDLYPTEVTDNSGNTFYSEIDVVAKK